MYRSNLYFIFFFAICAITNAQTTSLTVNSHIVMPQDSLEGEALLTAVNAFLSSAQENSENKWILATENVETQILIDEIQSIQKSVADENDSFFTPCLTKITPLENNSYTVHVAYIGINEDTAVLRASFEFIAHKSNDSYLISSPLVRNTQNWRTQKIQNHTFHYPYTLDVEKVKQYYNLCSFYDEKLENNDGESHYYLCSDETDPLKLFGVEYKLDYNGDKLSSSWISSVERKNVLVLAASDFYNFDTHDLWHNRLSQVVSRSNVHRRVDCHIATLYGGLWGKSWEELFPIFSEKFVTGDNVDWLEHKKNSSHFETNGHKNYTDDFVGALIVEKIEKEKGFEGVWELLMTKRTKEEEEYFTVLANLIGITKENYNSEVFKLIEAEMYVQGII